MERRQHPRWDGNLNVHLTDPSGLIVEAVGLNVSMGGLCLIFPHATTPQVDQVYAVSFKLPNLADLVENEVRICWIDTIRDRLCGGAFIQGLRAREVVALQELLDV